MGKSIASLDSEFEPSAQAVQNPHVLDPLL